MIDVIKVKLATGEEVNLDPSTVDAVRRGDGNSDSVVEIGGLKLSVLEAPVSLGKRVRAALKAAGVKSTGRPVVEAPARSRSKDAGDGPVPGAPEASPDGLDEESEGDFLPPGGEGPGGLST